MKIECTGCSRAYRISDELVYKISKRSLQCADCGESIPIENFILDEEELNRFSSGDGYWFRSM